MLPRQMTPLVSVLAAALLASALPASALPASALPASALPASALTLAPDGVAQVIGHAAGTFGTLDDPSGFAGGLAWGPDGSAYTLDGARVLYRWNVQTGRPVWRTVLRLPSLPDAKANFGPRLRLDGYRVDGRVTGPYILVRGSARTQPYQTAFTLTGDGRAVLGSLGDGGPAVGRSPDWRFLGRVESVTSDGRSRLLLSTMPGTQPPTRLSLPAGRVLAVEPSPDGRRVAAVRAVPNGSFGADADLWLDIVARDRQVVSRKISSQGRLLGDEPQVHWIDRERLLTAAAVGVGDAGRGQRISLWNLSGQHPQWELRGHLRGAVPSPGGRLFLTVRGGSVPELRRISDGSFVRALGAAVSASVPLSGGRALLALDTGNGQGELRVVFRGGRQARLGAPGLGGVSGLAVSADGRVIAVVREGRLSLLDSSGHTRHTLTYTGRIRNLQFSGATPRTLFARQEDDSAEVSWRGQRWDVQTGRLVESVPYTQPAGSVWLRADSRRLDSGAFQTRLVALTPTRTPTRTPLWQESWRTDFAPLWTASPDGRALVRAVSRLIPGAVEQAELNLYRLDPRTGQASPGLTLRPLNAEVYRSLSLLDFAADRRHALLGEGSGDGCGGAFYGLRLADLGARREVTLPAALTTGLTRFTGCGQPVPLPTASFTPEGALLVRDGNTLNWWRRTP